MIPSVGFEVLVLGGVLALLLALLVVAINIHGRRLEKHAAWMRVLELRVENLHLTRERNYVRSLQTIRPPPLSEARTIEVSEDMLRTLKRDTREDES